MTKTAQDFEGIIRSLVIHLLEPTSNVLASTYISYLSSIDGQQKLRSAIKHITKDIVIDENCFKTSHVIRNTENRGEIIKAAEVDKNISKVDFNQINVNPERLLPEKKKNALEANLTGVENGMQSIESIPNASVKPASEKINSSPVNSPIDNDNSLQKKTKLSAAILNASPAVSVSYKFSLPPGKQNESYLGRLVSTSNFNLEDIRVITVRFPDSMGLTMADSASGLIQGTARISGDIDFFVTFEFKDISKAAHPTLEGVGHIFISPDPKTLWKSLPVDPTSPYPKSLSDHSLIKDKGFQITSASQRGRSHAHAGTHRDDDFRALISPDGKYFVVAVADGAGSAKFSREGSRIAVEAATSFIKDNFEVLYQKKIDGLSASLDPDSQVEILRSYKLFAYNILGGAAVEASKLINKAAEKDSSSPRDFATTLLISLGVKFNEKLFLLSLWIGDGAISLRRKSGEFYLLGKPDAGEFAGQTVFLDSKIVSDGGELIKRIDVRLEADFDSVFVMTDGVSDPKFDSDKELSDSSVWEQLFEKELKTLSDDSAKLLKWLDFWSQGNHDDRTISIVKVLL